MGACRRWNSTPTTVRVEMKPKSYICELILRDENGATVEIFTPDSEDLADLLLQVVYNIKTGYSIEVVKYATQSAVFHDRRTIVVQR